MITKLVFTDSYDFGETSTSLIPICKTGVDSNWLRKHASAADIFAKEISELKPKPGHSVIHIIALGDEERYGCNRNGDAFSEEDTKDCHKQFKDNGHVFQDHKNNDPELAVGKVLATAHNPEMHRVELLNEVNHKKIAKRNSDKLENGEDLAWSMGSLQNYDECSICKHKAPTAKEHCEHVKEQLLDVTEDGKQVYMKNPKPKFFDISIVGKPADRIGYSIRKVAYGSGCVGGHELAEQMGIDPVSMAKQAVMQRIAAMEKRIPVKGTTLNLSPKSVKQLKQAVESFGISAVVNELHKTGCLLSPRDFADIIVGHPSPSAADSAVENGPKLGSFEPTSIPSLESEETRYIKLSDETCKELYENCGMGVLPYSTRMTRVLMLPKTASILLPVEQSNGLALLYQHYKLAFACYNQDRSDILRAVATIR